jgi:hypothetical protein
MLMAFKQQTLRLYAGVYANIKTALPISPTENDFGLHAGRRRRPWPRREDAGRECGGCCLPSSAARDGGRVRRRAGREWRGQFSRGRFSRKRGLQTQGLRRADAEHVAERAEDVLELRGLSEERGHFRIGEEMAELGSAGGGFRHQAQQPGGPARQGVRLIRPLPGGTRPARAGWD